MIVLDMLALILAATTPQITPGQAHQDAEGPSTMCDVTGRNALDLMAIVRKTPRFREQPIGSSRFELYATEDSLIQWTFARPSEPSYPAVSCRQTFRDAQGGMSMTRALRCDASRAACDALFVELRDLDAALRRALNGH